MPFLLGCGTSNPNGIKQLPPEIVTKLVYPTIPQDWLTCQLDPAIGPSVQFDTDIPYGSLEDAWHDCWLKLGRVRDLVATWSKM